MQQKFINYDLAVLPFLGAALLLLGACSSDPKNQVEPVTIIQTDVLEIPAFRSDEKPVKHFGYSVLFDKTMNVPKWVGYHLTRHNGLTKTVEITRQFNYDLAIEDSPGPHYYEKTEFDRGQMAPAEDMRWSPESMQDSFLMTNITPQKP